MDSSTVPFRRRADQEILNGRAQNRIPLHPMNRAAKEFMGREKYCIQSFHRISRMHVYLYVGSRSGKIDKTNSAVFMHDFANSWYGVWIPVTFEQAVNEPILRGRSLYLWRNSSKLSISIRPSCVGGMTQTSAIVSYHDVWLEWCSMCVTKTTGLFSDGIETNCSNWSGYFNPNILWNFISAAVIPNPTFNRTSFGPAFTCCLMISCAFRYACVIIVPVMFVSVCVLPTNGRTSRGSFFRWEYIICRWLSNLRREFSFCRTGS